MGHILSNNRVLNGVNETLSLYKAPLSTPNQSDLYLNRVGNF